MILKLDTDVVFKRGGEVKRGVISLWLPVKEKNEIAKMAALLGLTTSQYLRVLHRAVKAAYEKDGKLLCPFLQKDKLTEKVKGVWVIPKKEE